MMKLYKKMVRPCSLEGAWQGIASCKTYLADWMNEEEKTKSLEKEMEQKCKKHDHMSTLVWEEKYESVGLFGTFEAQPLNDLQIKKIRDKEFINKLTENIPTWKLVLIDKLTDFKVWLWLKTHKGVDNGHDN